MRASPADRSALAGLYKPASNLFRDRNAAGRQRIDLSAFCQVLAIDPVHGWVDVEGLATYEAIVAQTLGQGVMPAVVPQLRTITAGGAVAGVGIEATSHRFGLVHHTLLEADVLLPGGDVVHCTPTNAQQDLFYGFPNSYGSLGYALRLRLRTRTVKPFVRVEHLPYSVAADFFAGLAASCQDGFDFVDGVVFSAQQQILNLARFVDEAPYLSDYGYRRIYYQSLPERPVDYLRVHDYLWRWDTDWFWCSKHVGAQHPLVRLLLGRSRLNSRTYTRIMRWNARLGLTRRLAQWRGRFTESVIQDVEIPITRAAEFLDFLLREIGITPIWICPVRTPDTGLPFALFPMTPGSLYVNFGFWDVVETRSGYAAGHFNRLIEQEVLRLGGIKSLYSDSYYSRAEFAQAYGMDCYSALKAKYDPQGRLPGLYEKCVLRA